MGLVPNPSKTFRRGFFRESCGVDAFKGVDVTPHRLRKIDASTVSGGFSMCTLAKALYMDGFRLTADVLYRYVSQRFGLLPVGNNPDAQGMYRYHNVGFGELSQYDVYIRFNYKHHKWESPCLLVGGVTIDISNGAWWHLQDSLLRLEHSSIQVTDRGLEYAVPHRVRSKRGWTDVLMTSEPRSSQTRRATVARQAAWLEQEGLGEV
jgi:hypothetical protein